MELELAVELKINISDGPIDINGVIKAIHDFRNDLGRAIMIETIEALDRLLCDKVVSQQPGRYRNKGYGNRQFRTPMGPVSVRFTRYRDSWSGTMCSPGRRAMDVPAYKRWLPWCLTPAAGLLAKVSYEQSSKEAQRLQGASPSKSTVHRRLEDLIGDGSYTPNMRKRWFRYLMVDGTGARFQKREDAEEPKFYEGEIRFAFASVGDGRPFELVGMWVNKSWRECSQDLYNRLCTDRLEVLISDGGPGIEEAFLLDGMRLQRCTWHGKRDLSFLLYADGVKKAGQQEILAAFDEIPLAGIQKDRLEQMRTEDVDALNDLRQKSLLAFCDLHFFLLSKGYHKAAEYLGNLARPFVTFVDHLVDKGAVIPATSNVIEGKISLFKNRIKSIGKRWSEKGLLRWLAIAVRKLLPDFNWESLWKGMTGDPLPVSLSIDFISTKTLCH